MCIDFTGLKVGKISKMTEFNYYYTQVSVLVIGQQCLPEQ